MHGSTQVRSDVDADLTHEGSKYCGNADQRIQYQACKKRKERSHKFFIIRLNAEVLGNESENKDRGQRSRRSLPAFQHAAAR